MTIPVLWLAVHFVADFVLQSNWMATNKSKRWDALALHCLVYAACWLWLGIAFALITFVTHFITDAITSRITSRLWFLRMELAGRKWRVVADGVSSEEPAYWVNLDDGKRHWFFVVIGADQVIHYVTLAATGAYLFG